jgi:hypothetical protein
MAIWWSLFSVDYSEARRLASQDTTSQETPFAIHFHLSFDPAFILHLKLTAFNTD